MFVSVMKDSATDWTMVFANLDVTIVNLENVHLLVCVNALKDTNESMIGANQFVHCKLKIANAGSSLILLFLQRM